MRFINDHNDLWSEQILLLFLEFFIALLPISLDFWFTAKILMKTIWAKVHLFSTKRLGFLWTGWCFGPWDCAAIVTWSAEAALKKHVLPTVFGSTYWIWPWQTSFCSSGPLSCWAFWSTTAAGRSATPSAASSCSSGSWDCMPPPFWSVPWHWSGPCVCWGRCGPNYDGPPGRSRSPAASCGSLQQLCLPLTFTSPTCRNTKGHSIVRRVEISPWACLL